MFCKHCGNKLETKDGKPLVRYCPVCHAEITTPEVPDRSFMKRIGNFVAKEAGKIDEFIDSKVENSIRQRKHREKCEIHAAIELIIKFGAKQIGTEEVTCLRQRTDGKVYFGYNDQVLFYLIAYDWQGSEFATVSNTSTSGETKYKERSRTGGRRLAMGAGAVVGTAIAPGLGTAVGTAIGAGGPRKTKTRGTAIESSSAISRVEEIEKDTLAQLVLQNVVTKEIHRLLIVCNREIDGMFRCLKWPKEDDAGQTIKGLEEENEASREAEEGESERKSEKTAMLSVQEQLTETDFTRQLFQLKSLMDSGIITQEEFEIKKRQILNL